jgi:glycopeptide antibiotics resistance protein
MHSPDQKPSALGYALLTYMTLVIVAITLIPFEFRIPARIQILFSGSVSDIINNIILFIPLGFLFHQARRRSGWRSLLQALCFGVLVSASVETCQLFLPGRYCSVIDVATNGFGAWLGAAAAAYQRTRMRQEQEPLLFAFEMPLMDVVYLLIPLLWLGGLSMGAEPGRLGLTTLLGVFGGSVIASVHVNCLGPGRKPGLSMPAVHAAGWFLIGTLPAAADFPLQISALAAVVGVAAQLSVRLWKGGASERRFALPTLKKVFPLYALYLLLVSLWPTTRPLGEWSNALEYKRLSEAQCIVFTSRFIEIIAAFTLLGYMVAAMRGRSRESVLKTLCWAAGCASVFSIFTALVRDFITGPFASVLEASLFTGAALYGAVICRLQLAAVKRLKGYNAQHPFEKEATPYSIS